MVAAVEMAILVPSKPGLGFGGNLWLSIMWLLLLFVGHASRIAPASSVRVLPVMVGRTRWTIYAASASKENNGVPASTRARPEPNFMSPTKNSLLQRRNKRGASNRTPATEESQLTTPRAETRRLPKHKRTNIGITPLRDSQAEASRRALQFDASSPSPPLSEGSDIIVKAILRLFELNADSHCRWWPLVTAVNICNRLSSFHPATPLIKNTFRFESSLGEALNGLSHENFKMTVATREEDFDDTSRHLYLYHAFTTESQEKKYVIYADFSAASGASLPLIAKSSPKQWLEQLEEERLSIKPYMPHKLYQLCNFWHSTEAEKLFAVRDGETAREAACAIQCIFREAVQSNEAAKECIEGLGKSDPKTYYIQNFDGEPLAMHFDPVKVEKLASHTREKALFLLKAISLMLAADAERDPINWGVNCNDAMTAVNLFEEAAKVCHPKTIQQWFRDFRDKRKFPNPLMSEKLGIALFENYPDAAKQMRRYGNDHLQDLTVSLMQDFVASQLVVDLADKEGVTKEEFLQANGLKSLCLDTIHRWMRFIGFKRDRYRKGFYVDAHERPDVIASRIEYCIELFQLEIRSAVWVQLTAERVEQLRLSNQIYPNNNGIPVTKNGRQFFEFHVDDVIGSALLDELKGTRFGGHYSCRMRDTDHPTILWGQDEVVAHEKQQNSMAWYGPDSQQSLRPKDLGCSVMISGVVSREAGWHPVPNKEQLRRINALRYDKKYVATDAATAVFGSDSKKPLSEKDVTNTCFRW
jgi:hypothetical protein